MGYPSSARREIRRLHRIYNDSARSPYRHEVPVSVPVRDTYQDLSPRTAPLRRHSTRPRYQHQQQEARTRTHFDHQSRSPYPINPPSPSPAPFTPRYQRRSAAPRPRPISRRPSRSFTPADPSPARPPMDPQLGRWLNQMRADKAARRQERKEEKSRQRARERSSEQRQPEAHHTTTNAENPAPFRPMHHQPPAPVMYPTGVSAVPAGQSPYQAWVSEPVTKTLKREDLDIVLISQRPPQPGYAHVTQYARVPLRVPHQHHHQQRVYHPHLHQHQHQHPLPPQTQNTGRGPATRYASPAPAPAAGSFPPQSQALPIPPLPPLSPSHSNLSLNNNIDPNLLNEPAPAPSEDLAMMSDADFNAFLQSVGVDPRPAENSRPRSSPRAHRSSRSRSRPLTPRRSPARKSLTPTAVPAPPPNFPGPGDIDPNLSLTSFEDFLNADADPTAGSNLNPNAVADFNLDFNDFAFDPTALNLDMDGFGGGGEMPDLSAFGVLDAEGEGESSPLFPTAASAGFMSGDVGGGTLGDIHGVTDGDGDGEDDIDWSAVKVDFEAWLADSETDADGNVNINNDANANANMAVADGEEDGDGDGDMYGDGEGDGDGLDDLF